MSQNDISYWLGAATGLIFVNFAISDLNDRYQAKARLENDKRPLFDAKNTRLIIGFGWRRILRWGDPNLNFTSIKSQEQVSDVLHLEVYKWHCFLGV